MDEATKSVQEASKSAIEASKTAAGVSKNTFDDITYVSKSTFGDFTKSAKEAAAKKGLLKSLGESQQQDQIPRTAQKRDSVSNQLVASESRGGRRDIGRDFFSNVSNDFNGIATQTSNMFSDLFGNKSNTKNNQQGQKSEKKPYISIKIKLTNHINRPNLQNHVIGQSNFNRNYAIALISADIKNLRKFM